MDLSLATLKAVSFYLLNTVSTLNQCRKFSSVTVVCKHFASYQDYPNYKLRFNSVVALLPRGAVVPREHITLYLLICK
jgi:hypothetical protein